jgi:hypothetical protein
MELIHPSSQPRHCHLQVHRSRLVARRTL